MDALSMLIAKAAKENIAAEAKRPAPKPADVAKEAAFLLGWCKGKPIVRQTHDSTFWAAGKWMTKLDWKMALALVKAGHATLVGDPKLAGATLHMAKAAAQPKAKLAMPDVAPRRRAFR